jgi:type IV fimbrial biogenesis protein FimT
MPAQAQVARRPQRGASLVEASIVLAVSTLLASTTLPGWNEARERRQLDAASTQLATDLLHARSLAVAQARPVRLSFTEGQACYVVHTGAAGACSCDTEGGTHCRDGAQALRSATLPGEGRVALEANVRSMLFDSERGTVTPTATIQLQRADGATLRHVVNIMGRMRRCSPEGRVAGHPAC